MKNLLLFIIIPLSSLAAQPESDAWRGAAGPATSMEMHTLWTLFDLDRDGTLSAAELAASPLLVAALDTDEDGHVTLAELSDLRQRRGAVEFALLHALDANGDGILQPLEVMNAAASLKRLDRNGDGAVTRSEARDTAGVPFRFAARLALQSSPL